MDVVKTCVTCHEAQARSEFNKRAAAADGLQSRCRTCCRVWYERNRTEHVANVLQRNRRVREEYQRRLFEFLARHPCVDCGERDAVVLEFDHREGVEKLGDVTRMVNILASWKTVEAEMAKCEVCCANCHRRRTARRANQRRHRFQLALEAQERRVLADAWAEAWQDS